MSCVHMITQRTSSGSRTGVRQIESHREARSCCGRESGIYDSRETGHLTPVDQESKAFDRSVLLGDSRFRRVAARLPRARFVDSPTASALCPPYAAMASEMAQESLAPHPITTSSRFASAGMERSESSRQCSRTGAMPSLRFAKHSSRVRPWPFAPGTSAQYAMNQGPSCSTIAVNSLCIRSILLFAEIFQTRLDLLGPELRTRCQNFFARLHPPRVSSHSNLISNPRSAYSCHCG